MGGFVKVGISQNRCKLFRQLLWCNVKKYNKTPIPKFIFIILIRFVSNLETPRDQVLYTNTPNLIKIGLLFCVIDNCIYMFCLSRYRVPFVSEFDRFCVLVL